MVDENGEQVPQDNLRTLLYYLGLALDDRLSQLRKGTPYEKVRPSDVRVFVRASRHTQSISEIARELRITRQAAQMSVQRLMAIGVLELQATANNKRDKLVVVTPRGMMARKTANQQIILLENELGAIIGKDHLEKFRQDLIMMLESMQNIPRQPA